MSQSTKEQMIAIRNALLDIESDSQNHAAAFALANLDLDETEYLAKFEAEQADRAQAAETEKLRRERVMEEFAEIHPEIAAKITGLQTGGSAAVLSSTTDTDTVQ